jgi:5-methylcytosine-specific restriction enzyme subunit McrC
MVAVSTPTIEPSVLLQEQQWREIALSNEDMDLLRALEFEIAPTRLSGSSSNEVPAVKTYMVNPRQYVGHFVLPSGRTVLISPKIEAANIFRMLAYVYLRERPEPFLDPDVHYASDQLLFEPLVDLFNALVAKRARRGLYQSYIDHHDNLSLFRGKLWTAKHLQLNLARPDRIFCHYSQQTHDIEDNQIVKWALHVLLTQAPWSASTIQSLHANFHQFEAVSLVRPERSAFRNRHYHRLNDDYQLLHRLCQLFIDKRSISERPGGVAFRGFLLDMNELFEQFVSSAFEIIGERMRILVVSQASAYLSLYPVRVRPDVTIRFGHQVIAIVDAKYKRGFDVYNNPDIYQMLAYATALNCPSTFLVFPTSECERDGPVEIINSPVKIEIRRIDISDKGCISAAEDLARSVLGQITKRNFFGS